MIEFLQGRNQTDDTNKSQQIKLNPEAVEQRHNWIKYFTIIQNFNKSKFKGKDTSSEEVLFLTIWNDLTK